MDYSKLMIEHFSNIAYINFIDREEVTYEVYDVIIYFVECIEDIDFCVEFCRSHKLNIDNRVILVYKKGQKDFNRNTIIEPFKNGRYLDFRLKAPMLCALDKKHSAFVLIKE